MNDYQYLKKALKQKKKSITWLALEANVSKSYISKLLNNKISEPSNVKIEIIHDILGITTIKKQASKTAIIINLKTFNESEYFYINELVLVDIDLYCIVTRLDEVHNLNLKQLFNERIKIVIVTQESLLKIEPAHYHQIIAFTSKNQYFYNTSLIKLDKAPILNLSNLKNNHILLLCPNLTKLNYLLNLFKIQSDWSIYNKYEQIKNKNFDLLKELLIIKDNIKDNHHYLVGNEIIASYSIKELEGNIIDIQAYLKLFTQVIIIKDDEFNQSYIP
ncbi:MAG: helix-turn-helix domain-containing protein, partial [Bacilli bacterium]